MIVTELHLNPENIPASSVRIKLFSKSNRVRYSQCLKTSNEKFESWLFPKSKILKFYNKEKVEPSTSVRRLLCRSSDFSFLWRENFAIFESRFPLRSRATRFLNLFRTSVSNMQIFEIRQFLEVMHPYTRNVVTWQQQTLGIFWYSKRYFIQVIQVFPFQYVSRLL